MSRNMKFVADCLITECENITYDLVALPGGMPGALFIIDNNNNNNNINNNNKHAYAVN
jgi:putative intracellular protease/amidase